MQLSFPHTVTLPSQPASPWEAVELPVFIVLALACLVAGIWTIRTHARDKRAAIAHAEAWDRRLNDLVRGSNERTRAVLNAEFERTRAAYDHNSQEKWASFIDEVNDGFGRLEQHLTRIEAQFAGMHEQTSVRFNEAMVMIQQAGLAAARLRTHRGR